MGAALLLARYGCRVTLCEAGPHAGPLLRGFKRRGYNFDTGLHCVGTLGPGQALRRYLGMLGLLPHLELTPMRQDCAELFRFADGDICLPGGLEESAEALGALWPEHAAGIHLFMDVLRDNFLHSPLTNPENTSLELPVLEQGESAAELLGSFGFPPRLRSILMAHTVFMGTAPDNASLADYALVSYSMSEGMYVISGGGAALVAAFEKELAARGVELRTGLAVKKINLSEGRATSITLASGESIGESLGANSGETLDCDAVVYTGHPRLLPAMLPDGALRPSMARHLTQLKDTEFCISLYGSSASDFADGRFIYLCGSDDVSDAFTAHKSERCWITLSAGDKGPAGRRPVVVNINVPGGLRSIIGDGAANASPASFAAPGERGRPQGYAALKAEYADWALARLCERCPELADFELLESSTDYSMRQWVYGSTGSVYGVLHSLDQIPVLPRTKVPNLVLAGQGVILPGLLGALVSGAVAAGMLTGFDKVFEDFRNVRT